MKSDLSAMRARARRERETTSERRGRARTRRPSAHELTNFTILMARLPYSTRCPERERIALAIERRSPCAHVPSASPYANAWKQQRPSRGCRANVRGRCARARRPTVSNLNTPCPAVFHDCVTAVKPASEEGTLEAK